MEHHHPAGLGQRRRQVGVQVVGGLPALPGLEEVVDRLVKATFDATTATPYEAEVRRAMQRVLVDAIDLRAVRTVAAGDAIISPRVTRRMIELTRGVGLKFAMSDACPKPITPASCALASAACATTATTPTSSGAPTR